MLMLSRKLGDEILIGDNIRLVVNRIVGNRVMLGIAAPHDVHIVRGELAQHRPPAAANTQDRPLAAAT
jgi:carbon storage regulator CsrA